MNILKKENWWIWLLLTLFSSGSSNIVLGALLDVYDKDAWYANKWNWIIALVCFLFPFFIMIGVFTLQITCQSAAKLGVKGSEYYLSPYVWLLLVIVPVIGWTLLLVLVLYLEIWTLVALHDGAGNKYAKASKL